MARNIMKELKRTQILDGLEKCLLQKSFNETTIKDIAKMAGITHGVLHYYFESKRDILINFIDYKVNQVLSIEADWFSTEHLDNIPIDALFPEVLRFNLNLILGKRDDMKIILEILSIANHDEEVARKIRAAFKQIEEIEIDILSRTGLDKQKAKVISKSTIALFSGLSVCSISLDYRNDQVREILDLMMGFIPKIQGS